MGKGWEREYPYYKIQTYDDRVFAWRDVKHTFDTEEEARDHIATVFSGVKSRIVIVEGERDRRPIDAD